MTSAVNYWPDSQCAKAFWNQKEMPSYQELYRDTLAWLAPQAGQRWLDLGCGGGQLSLGIWKKAEGSLAEILGVDCASVNAQAYERIRGELNPVPSPQSFHFQTHNFSAGFPGWPNQQFDGVVSGLSLQYAEDYCEATGQWTQVGYDRILAEVFRVLVPGGNFVFSVNVPNPNWKKVAWDSLGGFFIRPQFFNRLKHGYRLWSYGSWLTKESKRGRFHYLTHDAITQKLSSIGFTDIEHRLSFSNQAYLFRANKR